MRSRIAWTLVAVVIVALAAFAWTEPEGSTNLFGRPATTVARRTEGGFLLSGKKSTISNGSVAETITVFARIEDGASSALSCFVVDASSSGVSTSEPHQKMGQRAGNTGDIHFENVDFYYEEDIEFTSAH